MHPFPFLKATFLVELTVPSFSLSLQTCALGSATPRWATGAVAGSCRSRCPRCSAAVTAAAAGHPPPPPLRTCAPSDPPVRTLPSSTQRASARNQQWFSFGWIFSGNVFVKELHGMVEAEWSLRRLFSPTLLLEQSLLYGRGFRTPRRASRQKELFVACFLIKLFWPYLLQICFQNPLQDQVTSSRPF